MACKVPHSRVACWLVVVGQGDAGRSVVGRSVANHGVVSQGS